MLLWCPLCGARHIDTGEFATKPHHTHACQTCGMVWRPAIVCTVGVQFLPGFLDEQKQPKPKNDHVHELGSCSFCDRSPPPDASTESGLPDPVLRALAQR
jgi:hypothetical protein